MTLTIKRNERPRAERAKLAVDLMNEIASRATYGSIKMTYVEGTDRDLCPDVPYSYANLAVAAGAPDRPNFVCAVDLLDKDQTREGIDQLVTYGLLPAYYNPEDAL